MQVGKTQVMKSKQQLLLVLLPPLVFLACMLLFFPFRFRFEFDFDEGINLIKAMMTLDGFRLYSDVWSDLPPIFNAILTFWFRVVGMNVNAGRVLVLGFSTLLLASVMDYLNKFWGIVHAIFGAILIVTLPFYTTLSVSVMIGLPSLTFAMMAFVGMTRWHEGQQLFWLVFSATFLGLSVMTKLWTIIIAPLFIAGIFLQIKNHTSRRIGVQAGAKPLFIWSLAFILVVSVILLVLVRPDYISQLVDVHLAAGKSEAMQSFAARNSINLYLKDSLPLFVLAFPGSFLALRKKTWNVLYLILWVFIGYLFLHLIVPNWHHHQLLVTIPAAIIASIALGESCVGLTGRNRGSKLVTKEIMVGILVLFAFLVYQRFPPFLRGFRLNLPNLSGIYEDSDQPDYEIIAIIRNYAAKTHYIFADRPMYAFRTGIPVHPYLAVITEKRYATGEPTQEEITSILEDIKPEQIIISRFDFPAVNEYMETRNFVRVDNSPRSRHYVLREIYQEP